MVHSKRRRARSLVVRRAPSRTPCGPKIEVAVTHLPYRPHALAPAAVDCTSRPVMTDGAQRRTLAAT